MNPELQSLLTDFVSESQERLARIQSVLLNLTELPPSLRADGLIELKRELHTLKGNSGMMGFDELRALAHVMEDRVEDLDPAQLELHGLLEDLDRFAALVRHVARQGMETETTSSVEGATQETSIRVAVERLDELVDLTSEILVARNRLEQTAMQGLLLSAAESGPEREAWKALEESRQSLDSLLNDLQQRIERLRMVPLRRVFSSLKRLVHDESARQEKQVRLVTHGEDTPLDNTLVEFATEALGHLVRNAVVHGIEDLDTRRRGGKPATGTILLSARVEARNVVIDVVDDGGGIDRQALLDAAAKAGLKVARDSDLQELVSHPGLSTRAVADDSAGRGIGLAAVTEAARRWGGSIEIDSQPDTGTRCRLQLPLAVSVAQALLVEVGGSEYALPATSVLETLELAAADRRADTIEVGGRQLPMLDLSFLSDPSVVPEAAGFGVLVEAEGRLRVFAVDELVDLKDIVVHRFTDGLRDLRGLGGTTILGDGRVVLILDPAGLHRTGDEGAPDPREEAA